MVTISSPANVFAMMPTGFGESFFQPCSPTVIAEEELSVVLVICPLIGLIEVQIKEGQPLGLTCASLQRMTGCHWKRSQLSLTTTQVERLNMVNKLLLRLTQLINR